MKSESITIRITPEQKKQIERIALKERRTVGSLVYNWIEDRLQIEGNKND